jgi:hypothetical protein
MIGAGPKDGLEFPAESTTQAARKMQPKALLGTIFNDDIPQSVVIPTSTGVHHVQAVCKSHELPGLGSGLEAVLGAIGIP